MEPGCRSASDEDRDGARQALTGLLHTLNTRIDDQEYVAGSSVTLADIALASALLPLYQDVLGRDVQATTPNLLRWLRDLLTHPNFHAILGK